MAGMSWQGGGGGPEESGGIRDWGLGVWNRVELTKARHRIRGLAGRHSLISHFICTTRCNSCSKPGR